MPIYTRFGDRGETRLFDGARVSKDHLRVRAYGEVDELNSALGVVRSCLSPSDLGALVLEIQKHLMGIGAVLANPQSREREPKAQPDRAWVAMLEQAIDRLDQELSPLQRFILPGGGQAASHLHMARTICRRAERHVVELAREAPVEDTVLEYINRLSDLLFVLARAANHREGIEDVLW